jgi:hypothetical protein
LLQARRLGVTALLVGLALWHIKGLRKTETFIVSNVMLQEWDIQPDAKRRALRALERAGLIRVERRGKCSPSVALIVGASDREHDAVGNRTSSQLNADVRPHSEDPLSIVTAACPYTTH